MATKKRSSRSTADPESPHDEPASTVISVISKKTCPSLSGNCTITYHLGLDPENNLHVRLHENSGGGFFNDDWYPAAAIAEALGGIKKDQTVTSRVLAPLCLGQSANTPAFLTAVLRAEGVLLPYKRMSRRHVLGDLDGFLAQAGKDGTARTGPAVKKKAPVKTAASSSEKPAANKAIPRKTPSRTKK